MLCKRSFNSSGLSRVVRLFQIRASANQQIDTEEQKNMPEKPSTFKERYFGHNSWKTGLATMCLMGLGGYAYMIYNYGPVKLNEDGSEVVDRFSSEPKILAYPKRALNEIANFKDSIRDPVSESLLPDLPPPQYIYPRYTLVLEANNILIHPEWTFSTGWRFKKRPALELFLQQVSEYYEVVCLTKDPALTMAPILEQLDPEGRYIHYRLFRESTRYKNGVYYKDLTCLNRPMERLVLVDCDEAAGALQPENFLRIPEWSGDETDSDLIDLAACLRMIAMMGVDDVRPAVQSFQNTGDSMAAFRERQQLLVDEEERRKSAQVRKTRMNWSSKLKLK